MLNDHTATVLVQLRRREFLLALAALSLTGCGGGDGNTSTPTATAPTPQATPTPIPSPTPVSVAPAVAASIAIGAASGALLSSRYAGFSYEKSKLTSPLLVPGNTPLVNLYGVLGAGVMRIGGNSVDKSSWNGMAASLTAIMPAQIDALAAFVQATGWQVIYGINLAQNTTANAASEASYVASRLGASLLGFEIGNEPDLYYSNGLRASSWTYADFLAEWQAMAAAIRAAVPGAILTGPAAAENTEGYTVPFAGDESTSIAMLTQHYYRANGQNASSTLDLLLLPDPALASNLKTLVAAAAAHGIAQGFRMAECNSFYNGGAPNVSDAYGTALWSIDFLFTCALSGATGANFHGGGSGPGYTPIADSNGVVQAARPEFYGMALFAQGAQGRAAPATITLASALNFTAYGVHRDDGGLNVMLVNKDPTNAVQATITAVGVNSFQPATLSGPALNATEGILLNGKTIDPSQPFQPVKLATISPTSAGTYSVTVPPISATLLRSA